MSQDQGSAASGETRRPPIDVWVGTNLGVLKGVSLSSCKSTSYLPGSVSLSDADRTREVCAMCWEHGSGNSVLYCGLKNGRVQRFSCRDRVFVAECDCTSDGGGTFVGLGRHDRVLVTCSDNGVLSFWPDEQEKSECSVGSHASCMVVSPDTPLLVATGGKENDLKLWDGTTPTFQAKNVKNSKLDLRVPVWVNAIDFISEGGAQPTVAVGTGHHQVRLYDTRAQRRPVYSHEFGDSPISALAVTPGARGYLVGNSLGELARFDTRTGKLVNHYKGFAGAVKSIQCSFPPSPGSEDSGNLVAACGLDRYLRVYTIQPPKLTHQVYLKLQSSCLLFSNESANRHQESDLRMDTAVRMGMEQKGETGADSDEDDVWNGMETVRDERKRVKSTKNSKPHLQRKLPRTA